MCMRKLFFCRPKSNHKSVFLDFSKKEAVHGLCRGIKQNKENFFKLQQDFIDPLNFAVVPTKVNSRPMVRYVQNLRRPTRILKF